MTGNLLHVNAAVACPHAGQTTARPSGTRVLVDGQAATTVADFYSITGCTFTAGNKPQPCVTVQWTTPATRVTVNGSPVLLQSSTGVTKSAEQVPQGAPQVTTVQQRVAGQ